jgi:hypothetical protein
MKKSVRQRRTAIKTNCYSAVLRPYIDFDHLRKCCWWQTRAVHITWFYGRPRAQKIPASFLALSRFHFGTASNSSRVILNVASKSASFKDFSFELATTPAGQPACSSASEYIEPSPAGAGAGAGSAAGAGASPSSAVCKAAGTEPVGERRHTETYKGMLWTRRTRTDAPGWALPALALPRMRLHQTLWSRSPCWGSGQS